MAGRDWKPNPKTSLVDQRVAAQLHLRQIEAIIRAEAAGDAAASVWSRAWDAALTTVSMATGSHWDRVRRAVDQLRSGFSGSRSALAESLRSQVAWSHRTFVEALADSVPRSWFRRAAPKLALVEHVTEAKRYRRPDVVPQTQTLTKAKRGGGGGGKQTSTAIAGGAPDRPPGPESRTYALRGQAVGPIAGADLRADSYTEPVAGKGRLGDEQWAAVLKEAVFPPPTAQEAEQILSQQINGQTWQDRFNGLSKLISNPDQLMSELALGFSQGEPIEKLRKRVQPLVDNVQSSARRIARTEGLRVAETVQRMGWSHLGDMLLGVQILAVLDQWTRPEHAARNGKIFFASAEDGSPTLEELPNLPDAPNCRCWSTPVLRPPKEFEQDPAVQAAFANHQGAVIPDPATYDQWFAGADETRRKLAVGVRRYNAMAGVLGETRAPEWTDFIGPDGALLPIDQLKGESAWDRSVRKASVQQAIDDRRRLLQQVGRTGFVNPSTPSQIAPDGNAFVSGPHLRSAGAAARNLTTEEISAALTTPIPVNVTVDVHNQQRLDEKTRSLIGRALGTDELLRLSGACSNSYVSVSTLPNGIEFQVESDRARRITFVGRDSDGRLFVYIRRHDTFPGHQRQGLATRMTASQVLQARSIGAQYVELGASRSKKDQGYIVWPKIGFDAELIPMWIAEHREQLTGPLISAKSVSDLLLYKQGEELWERFGTGLTMRLGLSNQSEGLRTMARYVERKRSNWSEEQARETADANCLESEVESKDVARADQTADDDRDLFRQIWDENRELRALGLVKKCEFLSSIAEKEPPSKP